MACFSASLALVILLIVLMVSLLCCYVKSRSLFYTFITRSLACFEKPGIDNPQPVNPGNHVVNSSDPNSILMGNTQERQPKKKCSKGLKKKENVSIIDRPERALEHQRRRTRPQPD